MKTLLKEKHGGYVFSACVVGAFVASLAMALLFSTPEGGLIVSEASSYFAYLSTQVTFALVLVAFFAVTKAPLREVGVRKCRPKYFLYALLLQFGLLFALGDLNNLFVELLKKLFGYEPSSVPLPSLDGFGVVGVIFAVALVPAICEEMVFRGVMVNSVKKSGVVFTVLVNGALFSLFHMNPAQTIYQFLCGCAFALMAYRSGSVFPTVLAHFLNNAFVILSEKFAWSFEGVGYTVLLVLSALSLIAAIVLLVLDRNGERGKANVKEFLLASAVGVAVCLVFWISGLIA